MGVSQQKVDALLGILGWPAPRGSILYMFFPGEAWKGDDFCAILPIRPEAPMKPPHILYILADDMGYGDLSCLNPKCVWKTPHFDRMARGGMAFTDAHSSSAVCTPSRYSILTGRYNWRSALQSGVTGGTSRPLLEAGRTTVASFLRNRGYETSCIGKWHLGWDWGAKEGAPAPETLTAPPGSVPGRSLGEIDYTKPITGGPLDHGFDHFFGISASLDMPPYVWVDGRLPTAVPDREYAGDSGKRMARPGPQAPDFVHEEVLPTLTEKVIEQLRNRSDKPQFIYFPLPAPHTPILPTAAFRGKSGTTDYGDFVLMCDDAVGQILDELDRQGMADDTLVIYTSDNGCSPMADYPELAGFGHNPSHVFRGHKADIFEGGHRVPLLARWPKGMKAGASCDQTVCLSDLLATVAEITHTPLLDHEGEDSVSMMPLFISPATAHSRDATVHHSINGSFSIRRGRFKLELCPDSGGWSYPKPGVDDTSHLPSLQLYDLADDVGEKKNVHSEHPQVVEELTSLLLKTIHDGRSTPGARQPNTGDLSKAVEIILSRKTKATGP